IPAPAPLVGLQVNAPTINFMPSSNSLALTHNQPIEAPAAPVPNPRSVGAVSSQNPPQRLDAHSVTGSSVRVTKSPSSDPRQDPNEEAAAIVSARSQRLFRPPGINPMDPKPAPSLAHVSAFVGSRITPASSDPGPDAKTQPGKSLLDSIGGAIKLE